MPDFIALITKTIAGATGFNTLTVLTQTVPIRFQLAPGTSAGLGIAGAPFSILVDNVEKMSGTTDANGEVSIPLQLLQSGRLVLRVFDSSDYLLTLQAELQSVDSVRGQQKRLDLLGYMTGYQLIPIGSATPDDGADGPRTQQSILNFQADQAQLVDPAFAIDGDVGPQTKAALKRDAGA